MRARPRTPGRAGRGAARAARDGAGAAQPRPTPTCGRSSPTGGVLRLLRDSTSLAGQAYVEFDLEAIFDGDLFADFALLYLLATSPGSRSPTAGNPVDCWLERWRTTAIEPGRPRPDPAARRRRRTRSHTLGTGFLQHPANAGLRDAPRRRRDHRSTTCTSACCASSTGCCSGPSPKTATRCSTRHADPDAADRYRQLLLLRPAAPPGPAPARQPPTTTCGTALSLVLTALGRDRRRAAPRPARARRPVRPTPPPTCSPTPSSATSHCSPPSARCRSCSPRVSRAAAVDFRHLGAEELGSIYESLLELVPRRDPPTADLHPRGRGRQRPQDHRQLLHPHRARRPRPRHRPRPGPRRRRERRPDPEAALLAVTVCDPAIGSGHFMVAAARRIATRLATVRTGEIEPTPSTFSRRMHDVVARCIYGVDVNPMAADLAKVSLWLEAMSPGRPLSSSTTTSRSATPCSAPPPRCCTRASRTPPTPPSPATTRPTVDRVAQTQRASSASGQDDLFSDAGIDVGNDPPARRSSTTSPTARHAQASPTSRGPPSATRPCRPTRPSSAPTTSPTPGARRSCRPRPRTPTPITHARARQLAAGTSPRGRRRGRRGAGRPAPALPLAPGVPRHLPRRRPRPGQHAAPAGPAASPPCSATHRGNASSCRSRSSSRPASPTSPKRAERRRTQDAIAALARQTIHTSARRVRVERSANVRGARASSSAHQRPLPAVRRRRRQHLQRLRGALPRSASHLLAVGRHHPHRTCHRRHHCSHSSPTLRTRRLAAFYDFENEAKIFRGRRISAGLRFCLLTMTGARSRTGTARLPCHDRR